MKIAKNEYALTMTREELITLYAMTGDAILAHTERITAMENSDDHSDEDKNSYLKLYQEELGAYYKMNAELFKVIWGEV